MLLMKFKLLGFCPWQKNAKGALFCALQVRFCPWWKISASLYTPIKKNCLPLLRKNLDTPLYIDRMKYNIFQYKCTDFTKSISFRIYKLNLHTALCFIYSMFIRFDAENVHNGILWQGYLFLPLSIPKIYLILNIALGKRQLKNAIIFFQGRAKKGIYSNSKKGGYSLNYIIFSYFNILLTFLSLLIFQILSRYIYMLFKVLQGRIIDFERAEIC